MKQPKASSVTVFPPVIQESVLSNKYELIVNIKWGDYDENISQSKEEYGWQSKIFSKLTEALLKASETTKVYAQ